MAGVSVDQLYKKDSGGNHAIRYNPSSRYKSEDEDFQEVRYKGKVVTAYLAFIGADIGLKQHIENRRIPRLSGLFLSSIDEYIENLEEVLLRAKRVRKLFIEYDNAEKICKE